MVADVATQTVSCASRPQNAPQAADQARRLGALRAGERVRLVEDEEVEPGVGEELDVPLARQQQLELLDVGEQDPRLAAGVRITSREQTSSGG